MTPVHRLLGAALVATALCVALPAPAEAQTAARKAGRGLAGMTTSWLEIPGHMVAESRKSGGAGVPLGFVKGLGAVVPRTLVGVWEFVTCPFPWPAGYKPIMQPEFPWDHFDDRGKKP
jgi:putative exosortase-associated protein (TIGR04073 family)